MAFSKTALIDDLSSRTVNNLPDRVDTISNIEVILHYTFIQILRGTIVNRTYGTDKNQYISLF